MNEIKIGFEMHRNELPLEKVLPVRKVKDPHKLKRYQAIVQSMREVGMIEPLIVYPQKDNSGNYLLLDGHLRHQALKELGHATAECIVSIDDECFTYNNRVSRLPPIQCHKMIVKAVRNGVRPDRIAGALDMPLKVVRGLIRLLDGINEDAADLLRDKTISPKTIRLLKRVTGLRQIEIAELMVSANNFAIGYAEALIIGTPKDQLVSPAKAKRKAGLSQEDVARMEQEMEALERDFKSVEAAYTDNMMILTISRTYIKKLLENGKIVRFLNANHGEILSEFEAIVATETM